MAVLKSTMVHANEGDSIRLFPEANTWRLIFVREGSAICSVGRDEFLISETKNILIVPPTMDASIFPRSFYQHILVETNEQVLPGKDRLYLFHDIMETSSSILWLIFRQMDRKLPNYENVVASLVEALRQFLLAQADQGPNTDILDLERLHVRTRETLPSSWRKRWRKSPRPPATPAACSEGPMSARQISI